MAEEEDIWSTDLFDCCTDLSTCCYGFWCCPCLACTVSAKLGEHHCLPLCDICTPAITAACGLPLCAPPAALSVRAALRNRYDIKGSLCRDIAISCFCEWCSWCQMHRELKYIKKHSTVVNTVTVQQPAPMMMSPVMTSPVMAAPMMMAPQVGYMGQPAVVMTH